MELLRRFAAVLIALSLALPQRSCVNDGKVEIEYPLTNAQDWLSVLLIVALFLLPLLLLFIHRDRVAVLLAGVAVAAAGLYYVSYAATILASELLIGWYTYTVGTIVYLALSLGLLAQRLRSRGRAPPG